MPFFRKSVTLLQTASLVHMPARAALLALALGFAWFSASAVALGAEITTGGLSGVVTDAQGAPVEGVAVSAAGPSARYSVLTNARGQFLILGMTPDLYTVSAQKNGFEDGVQENVLILVSQTRRINFSLAATLKTIGRTTATSRAFVIGSTSDTFVVTGDGAQARSPVSVSSDLSTFSEGTVQGSASYAPGIDFDSLGNVSARGSKVDDVVYTYDSVPIPQGLTVDPGGNFVGAQTPTTGVGETSVTLAGYGNQSDNALGGVINQVPLVGTYPTRADVELGDGIGTYYNLASFDYRTASPDLRSRLALSTRFSSEDLSFGDGQSFYPGEASVVGIGLQARGQQSVALNYHYALTSKDDISFDVFNGQASYDQYGSPFAGETIGFAGGAPFPGNPNPNQPVTWPSRTRGFFNVLKGAWTHTGAHSLERVQLYQSFFGARANGPFWDDDGYGSGVISLVSTNTGHLNGLQFDGQTDSGRNTILYGVEHRIDNSLLDEYNPINDEIVHSNPTLQTTYAYLGDTVAIGDRINLTGTGRLISTRIRPIYGFGYDDVAGDIALPPGGTPYSLAALDPHASASYRFGSVYAVRATFDHNSVAPKPLETDFIDNTNITTVNPTTGVGNLAPFKQLSLERGDDITYSFEGGGRTQFRLTYFLKYDSNRIDSLPPNLAQAVQNDVTPSSAGIPGNVGFLRAGGFEAYLHNGPFTFNSNFVRAYSTSGSEFSYNDTIPAAIVSGHLYPVSYLPVFSASIGYDITPVRHFKLTPELEYESGYPYGVGKQVLILGPSGKPMFVNNDNNVNPGFNYYFLSNPGNPYNPVTNPYIATLGTPEGNDPNSLHSPPQYLLNLHGEGDLSRRVKIIFDVTNFLGNFSPTQLISNPYLVGPPGYKGGNITYENYYGMAGGYPGPYTLGNGIPTNNGTNRILPWSFGTAGYVGESWPNARTIQVRLQYSL